MDRNNSTSQSLGASFKFLLHPQSSLTNKNSQDYIVFPRSNRRPSTNIENEIENREKISISLKNILESKCTASTFGNDEVRQDCYYCDKCDPKHLLKFCENCFLECHFKCHSTNFDINSNKGEKIKFVCDCFKKLNHILPKDFEKKVYSCSMKILDNIIFPYKYFYCINDNQVLCSFCYFICHGDCHNKKKVNSVKEINSVSITTINICQCRHANHSDNNEFLLCLNFKEYQNDLGIRLLPLQFLNLCFHVEKVYENFTKVFIQKYDNNNNLLSKKINICFPLLNNICFLMNRKLNFSFYNEKILKIFSYERLSQLIRDCSVDSIEEIKFKFACIHICLFIHLKRLFYNYLGKCLMSSDYISGSIMQRLFFRQKIRKLIENGNNNELKLKIEDNINLLLQNLFPFLLELVKKPFYSLILFRNEIIRFLKYLCFLLKKNIFSFNQITQIINFLNSLHDKIIFEINFDDEIQVACWIVPFSLLSEIFLLLSIEFNDLIIEDLLINNNKNNLTNGNFIHYQDKHAQKLLRMILRSNTIVRKHIQLLHNKEGRRFTFVLSKKSISILKGEIEEDSNLNPNMITLKRPSVGIILDKYLQFYNESIKLFALGNNCYIEEIKKISNSDIDSYIIMDNKNYHFISTNNIFCEVQKNLSNKIGAFFINFKQGDNLIKLEKNIHIIIDNLMNKIIKENNNNENEEINSLNVTNKSNYSINEDDIYNYDFYAGTKKEKYKNYIKDVLEFNIDNNPEFFLTVYNNFNEYENEIILSNLDETISSLFVFFSDNKSKIISYELFSKLISILTLFFMSKKTMNHFIIGKNLKKINKFFHVYSLSEKTLHTFHKSQLRFVRKLLEFCELMGKGITTYAINLREHAFLPNLQKYIVMEHISEFRNFLAFEFVSSESENSDYSNSEKNISVKSFNDDNISNHTYIPDLVLEYKTQLKIIMKIFLSLYKFYDNEDFNNIKNQILELYHDFFDDTYFYKYYTSKNDKKFIHRTKSKKIKIEDFENKERKSSFKKRASIQIVNEDLFIHQNQIDISLLLTFFEIFSEDTYCLSYEKFELLNDICKFFDKEGKNKEKRIIEFFEENNLSLNEKYYILRFLRTICFIEKKKSEHIKEIRKSLTSGDYIKMVASSCENNKFPHINFSNINVNQISNETKLEFQFQYNILNYIMLLMKLYIIELNQLSYLKNLIIDQSLKKKYLSELVIGTKILADFFKNEKDIWNKPIIDFYQLTIEFLQKINIIIQIINEEKKLELNMYNTILVDVLTSQDFDIFNTQILYKYLSEGIETIFEKTKINKKINLVHFLDVYDNMQEANFIPDSLIEDYDYEYFYEGTDYLKENNDNSHKNFILRKYKDQFTNIQLNNILIVLRGISNDKTKVNYRKIIVDYFKVCLHRGMDDKIFRDLLLITTKMLYYDTKETRKFLLSLDIMKLFQTMKTLLNRTNYHIRISRKNYFVTKRTLEIMNQSKLALQFLQLLGKCYSSNFWNLIFTQVSKDDKTTIFQEVINTLQSSILLCDYFTETDAEMPNDILIILIANSLDFIKEFIITGKEHAFIVESAINQLLFKGPQLIKLMKTRLTHISNPFSNRLKILNFIKWKVIVLLIAYMNNGQKNSTLKKLIKHQFSSVEIFEEIIYSFSILLKRLEIQNPKDYHKLINTNTVENYVDILIRLYCQEPDFRNTLILKNCNFMFILLRILEEKYNQKSLYHIYHSKDNDNENINQNIIDELIQDKNNWSIHSLNAYKIYKFLNKIILGIEVDVKIFINEEKEEERKNSLETDQFEESELINEDNEDNVNIEKMFSISISQLIFFVRPSLTFFISKESMRNFDDEVNRDSAIGKYSGLTFASDFFLFDMIINKKFIMSSNLNKFFCDLHFKIFEQINYILIIIQNIFLIERTYKGPNDKNYNVKDRKNFFKLKIQHVIIACIQIIYNLFIIIIWMRYKFIISFKKNLLKYTNDTFVFRQKKDNGQKKLSSALFDFFQNDELNIWETIKNVSKKVSLYTRLHVGIIESICINREICIFIYSLILVILYLLTSFEFFLVIPVFFICNISPVAFSIYRAITSRFYSMTLLLIMTYLLTYILTWFCYFFLYKNFIFNDIFDYKNNNYRKEAFCSSLIQCFLFYLDYGIRTQFGIGDTLGKITYKYDTVTFILRWVQDLINYFLTIEVMRFLFLGVITEVFAELRNKNYQIEFDKNNICFICQISRDQCLEKNIDFQEHIQTKHFLWNYVYFLIYLHLNNSNDFTLVEKGVWDKIGKQDFSWIPKNDKK